MNSIIIRLILGYNFQQLLLGLKPIGVVFYTNLSVEVIELFDPKSFGEGVGYILFSVNLLKLDVTLIYDLSYKVIVT